MKRGNMLNRYNKVILKEITMATGKVVETIYGKYSKFEIVKKSKMFGAEFYVKKDGEVVTGKFSSLKKAVEWAENKG